MGIYIEVQPQERDLGLKVGIRALKVGFCLPAEGKAKDLGLAAEICGWGYGE